VANIPDFISDVNPRMLDISIDAQSLGFTLLLSFLVVLIFGMAPAILASKPDLNSLLKEGSRGSSEGVGRHRIRSLLVIFEIAMAVVLLVGSGLLIRSFLRVQQVSPGFNSDSILTMDVPITPSKSSDGRRVATFYKQVLEHVKPLPGVRSTAAISNLPLSG